MSKTELKKISLLIVVSILAVLVKTQSAYADLVFKSSALVGTGHYQNNNFTEIHLGGALHFVRAPLVIELHGFQRIFRNVDDFYGVDLDLKLKRQFQISSQYLIGTYLGPGYRFASNDMDSPLIDFSLVLSKAGAFSLHLGYKIIMLDWSSSDLENDNFVYLGFQI